MKGIFYGLLNQYFQGSHCSLVDTDCPFFNTFLWESLSPWRSHYFLVNNGLMSCFFLIIITGRVTVLGVSIFTAATVPLPMYYLHLKGALYIC